MGLELRRDKNHNLRSKWWYGRYIINGKRHFTNLGIEVKGNAPESLRKRGDMAFECSRTLAEAKLKELVSEAHSRKTAAHHLEELYEIKAGEGIEQVPLTEMEMRWEFLPAKKPRTEQATKAQKTNIRQFREFMNERYPSVQNMSQVTRPMVLAWLTSLNERKLSGASYNVKLSVMRGLFEQLGPEAGILKNPFAGIPYRSLKTVHRQPFTEKELNAILENCDAIIRPVVLVGMCTAMRRGDCCKLKWESVDLRNGFISVKTSKTGEMAEIPLFPILRAELENRPRNSEFVFPEAEEMYRTNVHGLTWRFKKALKDAKIKNTQSDNENASVKASVKDFHSLRTTWITMALTAGVPMELVRRVTGHSTVEIVLKHYFRPKREEFRHALESSLPKALTGGIEERFDLPQAVLGIGEEMESLTPEELTKKFKALVAKVADMTDAEKEAAVLAA
ncbi:tyrosine-type recombinase/integrase [Tichowtungia aerotolerans]|uniref:Tyrosine-type recombinase/integrase n=1 Tax=Tichowtungia aerotolerans TaxID=2697043 RepID=A0A6P1M8B3_9BACT|nr:site-specific integrase [Tichowtungia aerotolerans]QHI70111.1 tyrosine-type recombinase/integrase [Tichowtungia aerotolerans]